MESLLSDTLQRLVTGALKMTKRVLALLKRQDLLGGVQCLITGVCKINALRFKHSEITAATEEKRKNQKLQK